MIYKITNSFDLNKIVPLFNDIRFYMGHCVFDKVMGDAYVDNIMNPQIAFLIVKRFCFISGNIESEILKELIDKNFDTYYFIANNKIAKKLEEIYSNKIVKEQRYSMKKNTIFDINKLENMTSNLNRNFNIVKIDEHLAKRIRTEKLIKITDDYKENGIGFCCMDKDKIIGIASSNIFYKDGIEVNIKVAQEYQRKGIATTLASKLILECLKQNKKISWDAANTISVKLAEKLGFEYDSTYNIYHFSY